ncbi:MAG: DUF1013 domain-containing protein [Rhodospirillales bacterium]|nr:DUF1013 domain-containing protein [Alphaproteobacteria bacterium]USO02997.1 MAG: DUF1013 domain-containing protein [Rhodospirillales bacterium]
MSKPQEAPELLLPKATATWLIDNTALTFEQIADFSGLHAIEVQALADEDVGLGIVGRDPIINDELDPEELEKAQADPAYFMKVKKSRSDMPVVKTRAKGPKYTPVSKRGDKPDAIAWIIKNHPEISDAQITKLVGTTKPTIAAVRERTHPNSSNIRPRHPVELGLCSYQEIEKASDKGLKAQGKDPEAVKAQRQRQMEEESKPADPTEKDPFGGFDFSNFVSGSGTASSEE